MGMMKLNVLLLDDMTLDALTAFFGRAGLEDLKSVLRRRWQAEELTEEQMEDFTSRLVLFYYHHLKDQEAPFSEVKGDNSYA